METVEFFISDVLAGAYPYPVPAHLSLPQWIKDQPNRTSTGSFGPAGPKGSTYKRCVPFMDVMRSGYIIPLWCDLAFSWRECREECGDDGCEEALIDIQWANRDSRNEDYNPVEKRDWETWGNIPELKDSVQGASFTFVSPWIIKTPPGYSSLITQPFNNTNYPHPQIKTFTGLVNTDTYFNPITYFFHIKAPFTGIIKIFESINKFFSLNID